MRSFISIAVFVVASFIADASCQRLILPTYVYKPSKNDGPHIILPTYRPPPLNKPSIRTVREVNDEPQWLWKGHVTRAPATGDRPFLPPYIDDVKLDPNRRYTRSLDSPSVKRYGGGQSTGGRRDTGPTHRGYNRRNTRSIRMPDNDIDPFRPTFPRPYDPFRPRPGHPRGPYPTYLRTARDIQIPGVKKPSHRDVIIPNWNPNVRTNPWNRIRGRGPRSAEVLVNEDDVYLSYNRDASTEE